MARYPTAQQLADRRAKEIIDGNHGPIIRYDMLGTAGGYSEFESDTGEWVRYKDIRDIYNIVLPKRQAE